jgi:quercetin dioxygenase-like cupin family protein
MKEHGMERYKIDFGSMSWTSPTEGVRFKVFKQDGRQIRLVEFRRGFTEPDWCRKGHIGYILEGECEIDFAGRCVRYKAGDGIFILAGEADRHMARVIGEVVRVVLVEDV